MPLQCKTKISDVSREDLSFAELSDRDFDSEMPKNILNSLFNLLDETIFYNDLREVEFSVIVVLLARKYDIRVYIQRRTFLSNFEGDRILINPSDYAQRILKYGGLSESCFIAAIIYIERLKKTDSSMCLTSNNMQRLLLVPIMLASKFLDDSYCSNKWW